jgi:hypothetical protein
MVAHVTKSRALRRTGIPAVRKDAGGSTLFPEGLTIAERNGDLAPRAPAPCRTPARGADDPVRDPRIRPDRLPVSWTDARFVPPPGVLCGGCRGDRFWTRPGHGWCCAACHPPSGLARAEITLLANGAPA